ncbi:hypothetical protein [Bradyrhizobium sp. WSM3983]|uniref:hypothetical protein n=1 Tax=Bradyrhizobium sp. WSM3983 TaxID=1038867 RepID=UPI0004244F58|nr:hypothetical protein [Bradyrhizobium sp. WSM3983]
MVMEAGTIRMGMITEASMVAAEPAHVAMHCHAADMNASTEASHMATAKTADVRTAAETTHVAATAEAAAVTSATSAASAATCIGCADCHCRGKRGCGQNHQHSFHQNTPFDSKLCRSTLDPCVVVQPGLRDI